ncbi:formylglycine-generating enzyme family protein [Pseudanabaena sp. FACHB-1050]|uniref:Formylglycine-generating enzyme family protein n=2 Tax=Phormidium tenue TaxID=126344 RepID=A0ABR8CGG6_9CYAN|nr:formylglycine-generating enzyme family protein [Phormidium tenue FACHB-1050]
MRQQGKTTSKTKSQTRRSPNQSEIVLDDVHTRSQPASSSPAPANLEAHNSGKVAGLLPRRSASDALMDRQPIKVSNPPSIRDPLALVRSLRPLMRLVPSELVDSLDEQATAQQIAEAFVWQPIIKPVLEPWLDLVLVVDESESMLIWRQTVLEFRKLLRNYGTFRDVHLWGLHWEDRQFKLRSGLGAKHLHRSSRKPELLVDPSGRQLILVISDCVAEYWQSEQIVKLLKLWSRSSPVAVIQVLPEWMWTRTAIRSYAPLTLSSTDAGLPNIRLNAKWNDTYQSVPKSVSAALVPIVPLNADVILNWSQMVMGHCESSGYLVRAIVAQTDAESQDALSPKQQVEQFEVMSSPIAQRLMCLLAASPVITLPVIRLIQETMLSASRQMNVAEVLLGGLLKPIELPKADCNPNELEYAFVDEELRQLLLAETPVPDTVKVLSKYIERQFDKSLDEFLADLMVWSQSSNRELVEKARPFALVTAAVLKRKGGKYRDFVRQIEESYSRPPDRPPVDTEQDIDFPELEWLTFMTARLVEAETETWYPPLQTEEYTVATITIDDENTTDSGVELALFSFKVGSIVKLGNDWIVQKSERLAYRYVEQIDENVVLEMVSIAGGEFMMGSPEDELERYEDESPQHLVTVPDFYMGRYPVTQAQWRVVAAMPQVESELDPDPSNFKGDDRPVEQVSWEDAIEFCARLSIYTKHQYRLPTEAEWEYACRAGTTTPFHFGETISPELANYDCTVSYADSPTGEKIGETTPVEHFDVANAWGLSDMHGNVLEWCQDHWHSNYEDAPEDGGAWLTDNSETTGRVIRGGSWLYLPWNCRSAYRDDGSPDGRNYSLGFRVSCSAPETLQALTEE